MLISNPEHLSQIGCHINPAVFLEISVFGEGALVLPLRKGVSVLFVPKVVYVSLDLATV